LDVEVANRDGMKSFRESTSRDTRAERRVERVVGFRDYASNTAGCSHLRDDPRRALGA
jgi:hypothetical protein